MNENIGEFYYTKEGEEAALIEFSKRIDSDPLLDFTDTLYHKYPSARIALVGGIVRDAILGRQSKDYDLIAEGIEIDDLIESLKTMGRVDFIQSRAYGVIKFVPENTSEIIEIALPRSESYEEGRRASDATVEAGNISIEEDFSRRDFTFNAIGYDLRDKKLIDPFDGLADIRNKIVQAVGDPSQRFKEDPTRILRGIRFAVKYGFEVESETLKAMEEEKSEILRQFTNKNGVNVERVSAEKISEEFIKTIEGNPAEFLEMWDRIGLLKILLPEVDQMKGVEQPKEYHSEGDAFLHTKMVLDKIDRRASVEAKIAALLHDIGKIDTYEIKDGKISFHGHDKISAQKTTQLLTRFRLTVEQNKKIIWLIENHMRIISFPNMRLSKKIELAQHPYFQDLIYLAKADGESSVSPEGTVDISFLDPIKETLNAIRKDRESGRKKEIISGDDIIEIIAKENPDRAILSRNGKLIGLIKKMVNEMYAEHKIEDKEGALEKARLLVDEHIDNPELINNN